MGVSTEGFGMPVHYITLPLLVFTGIYAAIGLFFLVSYLRVPDMQSNHVRWFIAADFMAILYNVMRIFKYHAATCDTAYFWVRATHVVIPILAAAISGFLADYSRQSKQWIIQDMIVIFGVLALVSLFGGNYVFDKATCSISTKSFLHVSFFHIWFRPGPIATAIYGFLILSVLYASFHGLCWGIEGNPRETRPIIAGGAMMAVVIVSDVLTSYRLISFVFLGEFVFSFFLIAMCYSTNAIGGKPGESNGENRRGGYHGNFQGHGYNCPKDPVVVPHGGSKTVQGGSGLSGVCGR